MSETDDAALHLAATVEEPRLEPEAAEPHIHAPEDVAPKAPRSRSRVRKPRPVKGADDKPPTRGPSSAVRAPRAKPAPKIGPRIADLHVMVGGGLNVLSSTDRLPKGAGLFGQQLVEDAREFGEAWEAYCKGNPRVQEALERFLAASELGALVTLYAKAAMQAKMAAAMLADPQMAAMFAQMQAGAA